MNAISKAIFIVSILFFFPLFTSAQNAKYDDLIYKADRYFKIANYKKALSLYLEAKELDPLDPLSSYATGICYSNLPTSNEQLKAIKYLKESVVAVGKQKDAVPYKVYFYLGEIYYKNEEVDQALRYFRKYYRNLKQTNANEIALVKKKIERAISFRKVMRNPKKIIIKHMDQIVNSVHTEYNPVLSADELYMAYTILVPSEDFPNSYTEKIMITKRVSDAEWEEPQEIKILSDQVVGTAGMSHDGQKMLVFIGKKDSEGGDLYFIEKVGNDWSSPEIIEELATNYHMTSTGSITPDGKQIYFASNRPGGFGGMDLYVISKNENNQWGKIKNLGQGINTSKDEDAPFIHPNNKMLFYSSNGDESFGGRDVFKSIKFNDRWRKPVNMGYPINTPANDNYFTLIADGSRAYFSSDRKEGYGEQDIYHFDMPEEEANIPLTMIKGRILAGADSLPVPTKIKVVDVETNQKIKYVYNPSPLTGNYLIILPPGKNYDLIVESEGYMPYAINVNIPNQSYFYELYQLIHLNPISQFDVLVGQEVSVKNKFYDMGKSSKQMSSKGLNTEIAFGVDSIDLYDVMDALVHSEDSTGFSDLLGLMYTTNAIETVDFEKEDDGKMEVANQSYYYDESDTTNLVRKRVGDEVIYTLPTLFATDKHQEVKTKKPELNLDKSILSKLHHFYFYVGSSELKSKYFDDLNSILELLEGNFSLGIEISGYASKDGGVEFNKILSNKRANAVLNYFNYRGIVRRRIKTKAYGASKSENMTDDEARRVDVKIILLK